MLFPQIGKRSLAFVIPKIKVIERYVNSLFRNRSRSKHSIRNTLCRTETSDDTNKCRYRRKEAIFLWEAFSENEKKMHRNIKRLFRYILCVSSILSFFKKNAYHAELCPGPHKNSKAKLSGRSLSTSWMQILIEQNFRFCIIPLPIPMKTLTVQMNYCLALERSAITCVRCILHQIK